MRKTPNKKTPNKTKQKSDKKARNNKNRRDNIQDFIVNYLLGHPCVDCGETNILVLEFDHIAGNKIANISTMIQNRTSLKIIEKEIAKTQIRCANCHRIKSILASGSYRLDFLKNKKH